VKQLTWYDYRFQTPVANLPVALSLIDALRASGDLTTQRFTDNMLGDPIFEGVDSDGNPKMICRGSPGRASFTYTDPMTSATVTVPSSGDPATMYFAIRARVPPGSLPFAPATYGLSPSDPAVSAAVLGVWA
jgi:hypothetical protein